MTPKRYFVFGCLALTFQGGLIAAQNFNANQTPLVITSGSALGHSQAVNISLAMRATPPQIAPTEPVIKTPEQKVNKQQIKPKAVTKPKPAVNAESKPKAKPKTSTAKTVEKVSEKPVTESTAEKPKQLEQIAKQGVSNKVVAITKPTFSSPPSAPRYPKLARKRGFEGTATIEVLFDHVGEQLSLTLIASSGYELLDQAAIGAVEQWQFSPPMPQTAASYRVQVPVRFALN